MKAHTMKHIVMLIACAMLSACKEKPEVRERTWSDGALSTKSNTVTVKTFDFPNLTEIVRRSALAGLAMGLNRGNEGYEALSNELWAIYTDKTNFTVKTNSP